MKPITGTVVSSKSVSLSKAASVLSRFVASETGAQQDVSAYLRRASEAFDELARFHEELEVKRESSEKLHQEQEEEKNIKKGSRKLSPVEDGNVADNEKKPNISGGIEHGGDAGVSGFEEGGRSGRREKKMVDEREGRVVGNLVEVKEEWVEIRENSSERKKEKKKRKKEVNVEVGDGKVTVIENKPNPGGGVKVEEYVGVIDFGEESGRKEKNQAYEREGRVGGSVVVVKEEGGENSSEIKKKRKKRKKEEDAEEGCLGGVEDQSERHHKKRRKREGEVEEGGRGGVEDQSEMHHKKRRKQEGEEKGGGDAENQSERHHKKKKRKVREVD